MMFSAEDRTLIKVLRHEKGCDNQSSSWNFPTSRGHCLDSILGCDGRTHGRTDRITIVVRA